MGFISIFPMFGCWFSTKISTKCDYLCKKNLQKNIQGNILNINMFITSRTSVFKDPPFWVIFLPSCARWWVRYLSKRSLIKHTCSWHDKLIIWWTLTEKWKYFTYIRTHYGVVRWWGRYRSKRSLIEHTYSWRPW